MSEEITHFYKFHEPSDELKNAVGDMTIQVGQLEHIVRVAISRYTDVSLENDDLEKVPLGPLIGKLEACQNLVPSGQLEDFNRLISEIRTINNVKDGASPTRSNWIHAPLMDDQQGNVIRNRLNENHPVDVDELKSFVESIRRVRIHLGEFSATPELRQRHGVLISDGSSAADTTQFKHFTPPNTKWSSK